jgi:hypothetical protein
MAVVTEIARCMQPVTHDPFIDDLPAVARRTDCAGAMDPQGVRRRGRVRLVQDRRDEACVQPREAGTGGSGVGNPLAEHGREWEGCGVPVRARPTVLL